MANAIRAYWEGVKEGANKELQRQMPMNVFLCLCILIYMAFCR